LTDSSTDKRANTHASSSEFSSVGGAVPTSQPQIPCQWCLGRGLACTHPMLAAVPTSTPLDALLAEMDKILSATPNPTTEPFTAGFNVATYQWAEHLHIIMAASPASALVTGEKR
jgi:hypothetical protein